MHINICKHHIYIYDALEYPTAIWTEGWPHGRIIHITLISLVIGKNASQLTL